MSDKTFAVLYRSKTGFTKTYALWLAKELCCQAADLDRVPLPALKSTDVILYGGGLYAGIINGLSKFRKDAGALTDKRLLVFGVGSAPGKKETEDGLQTQLKQHFPDCADKEAFYLQGGFDFSRLKGMNRFLMGLMRKTMETPKEPGGFSLDYTSPQDFTKTENLSPLFSWVRR